MRTTIFSQVYLFTKDQLFYIGTKNYFLQPTINIVFFFVFVLFFPTGTDDLRCLFAVSVVFLNWSHASVWGLAVCRSDWAEVGKVVSRRWRTLPAPHVSAGVVSSS